MHILYYPRQHGKTQELIAKAAENPNGIIVTTNYSQAKKINQQVGREIAVPYHSLPRASSSRTIYIDDLENLLSSMFTGDKVDTATMSTEHVTIKYEQKPSQTNFEY